MTEGSDGEGESNDPAAEETNDGLAEPIEISNDPNIEQMAETEEHTRKEIIRVLKEEGYECVEKLTLEQLIETAKNLETEQEETKKTCYDDFIESLNPSIRWLFYIVRAFTDNDRVDVYKEILKTDNKIALLLPGRLGIPYKNRFKGNVIRVDTEDPDEIQKIIEFISKVKEYKPNLITYSKGSLTARRYITQYGNESLGKIIAIAPIVKVPGAHHVHAGNDRVIPFMNNLRRIIPTRSNKEIINNPPPLDKVLIGFGHIDLAYSKKVIGYVNNYLNPNG